jgi:hypothetical protein
MAYKPINTRQVANSSALSAIGSSANATLDVILSDINTIFANATASPTPGTLVKRDANGNIQVNNITENFATTVTAAGTTALSVSSAYLQTFTGTNTQVVTLPNATTLILGQAFDIGNRSTQNITVNNFGGTALQSIAPGGQATFTVTNISTSNGTWDIAYSVSVLVSNAWPNFFVTSEADLATAITAASGNNGGVICILNLFTMSSPHVIPAGTTLVGRMGGTVITVTGSGSIALSDGAKMQGVWFTTALTSGSMILLPSNYATIRECQFTIPPSSTGQCIDVTGNGNKMYNNVFIGVVGETATGIYYQSGVNNVDVDSVFFP